MKKVRLFAYFVLIFIFIYLGFVFYSAFGNNFDRIGVTGRVVGSSSTSLPVTFLADQIKAQTNPPFISDPFIFQDEDGKYYFYSTGYNQIFESDDLLTWTYKRTSFDACDYFNACDKINIPGSIASKSFNYTGLMGPEVLKVKNSDNTVTYLLTFSGGRTDKSLHEYNFFASSASPIGPFGPQKPLDQCINGVCGQPTKYWEPLPLRDDNADPFYLSEHDSRTTSMSINGHIYFLDGSFFRDDDGGVWYSYTGSWIVKLRANDLTKIDNNAEWYRLTDRNDRTSVGETCWSQNSQGYSYADQIDLNACTNEGTEIIKNNGKYYLFYSANNWNSKSYGIYYKMADTLRCLTLNNGANRLTDPISGITCNVKKGVAFDGIASTKYSYGHGTLVRGPDGNQIFHILTVRSDTDFNYRTVWVVEQEFNVDGTPKTKTPDIADKVIININLPTIYPVCGSAANVATASMPSTNLCSVGNIGSSSGSTGDGRWFWGCVGQNTGWSADTAWCFAPQLILCTESNWQYSISPTTCPSTSQQTKTWTKIGSCSGGISHPTTEVVPCNYIEDTIACINFTYLDWGECLQSNVQTRIVNSSSPTGCVGGNPITSQACTYVSSVPNDAGNTGTGSTGPSGGSSSSGTNTETGTSTNSGNSNENTNSNSEVIDLTPTNEQPGVIKTFFVKLICRLSNLFDGDNYESCKAEYLS